MGELFQGLDFFLEEPSIGKRENIEHGNSIGARFQLSNANNRASLRLSRHWTLTQFSAKATDRGSFPRNALQKSYFLNYRTALAAYGREKSAFLQGVLSHRVTKKRHCIFWCSGA
jgi:hypothetical protein